MKQYKTIHIVAVGEHLGEYPEHGDWFYQLRPERMEAKPLERAFKRRCHATRYANKISNKVEQWYAA